MWYGTIMTMHSAMRQYTTVTKLMQPTMPTGMSTAGFFTYREAGSGSSRMDMSAPDLPGMDSRRCVFEQKQAVIWS